MIERACDKYPGPRAEQPCKERVTSGLNVSGSGQRAISIEASLVASSNFYSLSILNGDFGRKMHGARNRGEGFARRLSTTMHPLRVRRFGRYVPGDKN